MSKRNNQGHMFIVRGDIHKQHKTLSSYLEIHLVAAVVARRRRQRGQDGGQVLLRGGRALCRRPPPPRRQEFRLQHAAVLLPHRAAQGSV